MLSPQERLKLIPNLPDSAVVSIAVAALHDDVSEKTVRRNYPLVKLSERRYGVRVGYLRRHLAGEAAAA
ncbi:MAG TPA: hypothetical protein VIQ05_23190 [Tardiphaga sp.]